ncbi:helix-turn-helix domain-containing protein [Streptomyces sp. N35]|uniref:transcriptional regulator n=1 Tax=Streptomyces sp. N35 TaxID=2795730 RepID=UPI0027DE289E|nr:helix-turn-helix domain-containing protein [Streptomyces sp. N35]
MSAQGEGDGIDEVAEFAALLRALKERTDRSYGSLARRLGMNTSTLHRYCAGDTVPLDFAPVERFASLCGATSDQRLELHRRWLQAVAARRRPPSAGAAHSASDARAPQAGNDGVEGPDTAAAGNAAPAVQLRAEDGPIATPAVQLKAGDAPAATPEAAPQANGSSPVAETESAPRPPGAPSHPSRPWYRRRRLAVGLAAVCAVLATLGSFSTLPDGRRASADGLGRVADTARATAPEQPGASPGPSDTPSTEPPSGSPTAKAKPGTSRPPGATSAPPRGEQPAGLPLTWSVNSQAWELGCGHDYVIAKPPSQVPPPPAPQDAAPWAAAQSAVHGGETLVQLSVQGRSDTAVVLEALRVRVVGRTEPAEGNAYAMNQGCGGALTPRYFAVDLDKDRPIARAVAGSDSGTPIPAVRMPYRVSAKDPEVLLVTAGTTSCDCRWYLELDWSSQGSRGTVRIDDDGRPFRTSAIDGLPRYMYDTLGRQWGSYS